MTKIFYILFFCFFSLSLIWSQETKKSFNPLWSEVKFISTGRDTLFVLPDHFLIQHTVRVTQDSLLLIEGKDYKIDFTRGEIFFSQPPDSGSLLRITYQKLPVNLMLQYRNWAPSDTLLKKDQVKSSSFHRVVKQNKQIDYGEKLQKSGSIFRGITIATNQGMKLQSGLRLQVSGMITPKVEVVASLTDQNTPIQPEGNTQTLQEIDKVFVNINAQNFKAKLGDYIFNVKGTNFAAYSRKLEGVMGTVESSTGNFTLLAAATKGEFTTNYFMGEEGKQGPYQLTGSRGQREIVVLAGTERVWIDGELMKRGEDNDYVIEYGNGQITFTRNRLITSDSRITVDFEYSDQKFQKNVYGAIGNVHLWQNRIKLTTSFLREADDKKNPISISLTNETKKILANAGDQADSAVYSGVKYIGENKGAYEKVDTAGVVFYRYVGENKGDYTVRFSYVGQGKGDYSFQGYGIYRYEGSKKGSYLPIIFLPMATSHEETDISSSIQFGKGISAEAEIGISNKDLNLYSFLDDNDNVGFAYSAKFNMSKRGLSILGKRIGRLSLNGRIRSIDDRFSPLGRITEVEHGRKWGIPEGTVSGEKIKEIQGTYHPISTLSLSGEFGSFRRGDFFCSKRQKISTEFLQPRIPKIRYQTELIQTNDEKGLHGYWLRQNGSIKGKLWWFTSSFSYKGEHREKDDPDSVRTGFLFDEWTGQLALTKGALKGEVTERLRDEHRYIKGILHKNSLARTHRFRLEFHHRNSFSSSFMYTHYARNYTNPSLKDQISDLADVKLHLSPGRRFLNGTFNYQFSSIQLSLMVRDTIKVKEGLGNYRYDTNLKELVPDPDGDILLRTIQTGKYIPVNNLKMGGEIYLDVSRLWNNRKGLQKFLRSWRSRSMIRIERKDSQRNFATVNSTAFHPKWGKDSTVVMGLFYFYQDLEYSPPKKNFSLRLRFRKEDSENHQLVYEGILRRRTEHSLRLKANPLKRLGFLFEFQAQKQSKIYAVRSWSNTNIKSQSYTVDISYRPKQKIELGLKTRIRIARDFYPDPITTASSFFLFPRFGYSFRGKGHFSAELEIGNIHSRPLDRTLPYEMLGGDQPGRTIRWTTLLTYRVTDHVMATLNYRGRHEPWRKRVYQTGQVEVRAFF